MFVRVQRYPVAHWPFERLFDFGREFDTFFGNVPVNGLSQEGWSPAINVEENENESVVVAELPGVIKEDLKISVHEGTLTIAGERKPKEVAEKSSQLRKEIRTGKFSRAIALPHEVKADAVSAELSNGVLRIVLPKAEEAKPREIPVQ